VQFQHKEYSWFLVAVVVIALLYFFYQHWKKSVKKKMGDAILINALIHPVSRVAPLIKIICLLLAVTLGVIALMNPRKPGESLVTRKGIDIAISLDVSKSMLASDLAPTRLARAKQFINKLMDNLPNDRIALIVFAGKAYLQMPLTVDHGAAALFVNTTGPEAIAEQGTVISDALEKAAWSLSGSAGNYKSILLITDGEDHEEGAVELAKDLSTQGVMINSIGIGSIEGTTITDPQTGEIKKDDSGAPVISKLNESMLKEISTATNGIYVKLESTEQAVSLVKQQLSQIDRKAFQDYSQVNFTSYYMWFAALMFVFLVLEIMLPENLFRKAKKNLVTI
jgi:Ca-activated chloride channel family protein